MGFLTKAFIAVAVVLGLMSDYDTTETDTPAIDNYEEVISVNYNFDNKLVVNKNTTLYSGAYTSYNKVGSINRGRYLDIVELIYDKDNDPWYAVNYEGETVYISGYFVQEPTEYASIDRENHEINSNNQYIYSEPFMPSPVIRSVTKGEIVTVIGKIKDIDGDLWYAIDLGDEVGFISKYYLSETIVENDTAVKSGHSANYHSSNDSNIAKQGNSGVYAYRLKESKSYVLYYIIDFDEGYVYSFTDGNGDSICDRAKMKKGNMKDGLLIEWSDAGNKFYYNLYFKWKMMPDIMILQDDDYFEYEFVTTNLKEAQKIKNTKQKSSEW